MSILDIILSIGKQMMLELYQVIGKAFGMMQIVRQ